MKKFVCLLSVIVCIFGLSACGRAEEVSKYDQQKIAYAEQKATQMIIPYFAEFMEDEMMNALTDMTAEDIGYAVYADLISVTELPFYSVNDIVSGTSELEKSFWMDGNVALSAIRSFHSAAASVGQMTGIGKAKTEIDGDEIIVRVQVTGSSKNAEAEIIMTNDRFLSVKAAALNPISTKSELMGKAGLNTLLGMGTVFAVLILICLLISCFRFIAPIQKFCTEKIAPKLRGIFRRKQEEQETREAAIDNAVAAIEAKESAVDETDDCELVAVIAAAIAASEGAVTTDGFVVRSIRRRF